MFLRGMPHLAEKMKRLTAKDDKARKLALQERIPDLEAISRLNPLPQDPSPRTTTSTQPSMDEFLSSLTDEEAQFLARRRAQMLDRAAQLAMQKDTPQIPPAGRDMDAFLASLSDEEAPLLARRREQELIMLQTQLGRPLFPYQFPRAPLTIGTDSKRHGTRFKLGRYKETQTATASYRLENR